MIKWNCFRNYTGLTFLLFLGACAVGEDYITPEYIAYPQWKEAGTLQAAHKISLEEASAHKGPWWELFRDKNLNWLIEQALANNNDLKRAEARILEARANELLSNSAFFPQISGSASSVRNTLGSSLGNMPDTTHRAELNGTLEIDLFGGNRRRREAAIYEKELTEAQKAEIRRSLISEVARNYMRLRSIQEQRALTQKNLELQRETLKITEAQRERQVVSELDLVRAKAQVSSTSAVLPQLNAQESEIINRLFVLIADKEGLLRSRLKKPEPVPSLPEPVVTMQPIDVIRNRPDVRTAERSLARATALTGAAFAEYFPKISLQGLYGGSYSGMWDGLTPWSAAANGVMPLLNFGRIKAGVDGADARQQQAFYNFQQAVLLAIEEVEVRMSAYRAELQRNKNLMDVATQQAQAALIAREQYMAGIAPQLDLIDAQRNALNAENELAASEGQLAQNLVLLYSALGEKTAVATQEKISLPATVAALQEKNRHSGNSDFIINHLSGNYIPAPEASSSILINSIPANYYEP